MFWKWMLRITFIAGFAAFSYGVIMALDEGRRPEDLSALYPILCMFLGVAILGMVASVSAARDRGNDDVVVHAADLRVLAKRWRDIALQLTDGELANDRVEWRGKPVDNAARVANHLAAAALRLAAEDIDRGISSSPRRWGWESNEKRVIYEEFADRMRERAGIPRLRPKSQQPLVPSLERISQCVGRWQDIADYMARNRFTDDELVRPPITDKAMAAALRDAARELNSALNPQGAIWEHDGAQRFEQDYRVSHERLASASANLRDWYQSSPPPQHPRADQAGGGQ